MLSLFVVYVPSFLLGNDFSIFRVIIWCFVACVRMFCVCMFEYKLTVVLACAVKWNQEKEEGRKGGRREEGREGGREERREGGREGRREGGKERRREGGRRLTTEGEREGKKD